MLSQGGARKRRRLATNTDTRDNGTPEVPTKVNNIGGGDQHNNFGDGHQNNNTGLGTQYNAHSMSFGIDPIAYATPVSIPAFLALFTFIFLFNKENDKFLTDLRITDPRDDKVRIQRTKGDLLVDSYRWILDHEGFIRWRAEKRLLWIKGGPGKGKTMLLCGMIDELLALGYKSTFFFFCQATDARLNSATSVLRGLLYVILDNNPPLLDLLRDKYDKAGAGIFKDVNSWNVLSRMLVAALNHESMRHVVLVIDALDECISDLDHLISFIIDLPPHVKVIASSLPELRIDRGLAAALEDTKIYLSLELNENVITAAVNCYINHKVDKLAILKDVDHETKAEVREYLATKANNTFLWVSLVYEQLADNRVAKRHIKRKLYDFPQGLNSLYRRILDKILDSLDAEECRQILATMSIVSRPLHLAELALLLDHIEFLSELVEECSSLLTIRGEVVYFIHQSAKDFLLGQASEILPLGIGHGHNLVLSKLLGTMSDTLRRNIYNVDEHGTPVDEILVPTPDPLASAEYACVYWADHFKTDSAGESQFEEVYAFICQHFLHWLEALSLLQGLNEGILSVFKIHQIIEVSSGNSFIVLGPD
ncbi:nacht and wd domain protein [Colletotrichum kahawae]|uniref:Nacht and wd domain protein n=1 Tax=Colletotrichum kahawae TaxID=34407 RepID=A0AAE0D1Z3_COLKA|nr:nacht and wd domain protein [Colletotrichum kahawae]